MTRRKIILASASPRRKSLLSDAGFIVHVIPPDIDENLPETRPPREHVLRLACAKARSVAANVPEGLVLGADTVVVLGAEIIGKPSDARDARRILERLSGTAHECLTALCLIDRPSDAEFTAVGRTKVFMRVLTPAMIEEYVASGKFEGKAGAYGVQDQDDPFIERLEGSFENVVGLPPELLDALLVRRDAWVDRTVHGGPP